MQCFISPYVKGKNSLCMAIIGLGSAYCIIMGCIGSLVFCS
ncbi:unnamed protein product [Spirodela intermedia]|uniref:Uncharacterized protein n=1 Tax=Spirodela intermedia TaxID=51605 RepID=A0ABN7EAZ1_SPIIN|nr:unnamed protein product [Spirodela intermedia]